MSGHSKWNNIKRKKEKTDAAKGKIFTKIGKEIKISVKSGGGNPDTNAKLRDLIAKAKANNVPNDNIERTIKNALGAKDAEIVELTYEGYGPSGVAVIVETATDNRNRTAGNVRSYFSKFGGNLGTTGCVSFLFEDKGVITINDEDGDIDEDKMMEDALEAGADDIKNNEGYYTVYTAVDALVTVTEALKTAGYTIDSADESKVSTTQVNLSDETDLKHMGLLVETLEEDDDVLDVYHNWENEDDWEG